MKTREISAAEFGIRFGLDRLQTGSYAYFACSNGMGIIRDNTSKSIEIVHGTELNPAELTAEEELMLMAVVCGDFKEDIEIPNWKVAAPHLDQSAPSKGKGKVYLLLFTFAIVLSLGIYYFFKFLSMGTFLD